MQSRTVCLLALLALVPTVTAHGEHEGGCGDVADTWSHLDVWNATLAPGESASRVLGFEGCPMEADWLVLLRGDVDTDDFDGTVALTWTQAETVVGAWAWGTGVFTETARLHHTDFSTLGLLNRGDANLTVRLYFDQTCLCTVKGVSEVQGPVWMNAVAHEGDTVVFEVTVLPVAYPTTPPMPGTITVRAEHVVAGASAAWPWDVQVLEEETWTFSPNEQEPCRESLAWTGCLTFTFPAAGAGRQDVLLWLEHDGEPRWSLQVRPVVDVLPQDQGVPGPGALAVLACLVAVALTRRR